MDRNKLKIAEPCSERWDEMTGDEQRRFCDVCSKHVHNLSAMTRQEARALLAGSKGKETPCITYAFGQDDKVVFADTPRVPREIPVFREVPRAQRRGIRRVLATAAFVPMLAMLPACDTSCPPEPPAIVQNESPTILDEIMEAEDRFTDRLEELFGFAPEYEVVAGEPMIVDWEPIEPIEPIEQTEQVEPFEQVEPIEPTPPSDPEMNRLMGDYLGDPADFDEVDGRFDVEEIEEIEEVDEVEQVEIPTPPPVRHRMGKMMVRPDHEDWTY